MTPPKQDGPSCPLPGCSMTGLSEAIKANNETMIAGFNEVNEMQRERIKQDIHLSHVMDYQKNQDTINSELRDNNRQLLLAMGDKVDKDTLTNAMETVRNNIGTVKDDIKWYNDTLKKDMKWFITFSLGGVTLAIAAINYLSK